jgi:Tol biopolymer transport system component
MGEVYRARDLKLKREVAIKVLPEEFSRDPERVSRFQREAEALAALNHPNIAAVYDLQESNATRFLVMELVDGETLADRLQHGPLPLDESLQIAKQIATALEMAHDKGIVHRDLKPANIKVTPNGTVKVLDFGLAKAFGAREEINLSNSPTVVGGTMAGVILGTAAYMSPEQARGKVVDRRADVWAFGCVLYEMLTGRQTFPNGETLSDTLAGVLAREPDWASLPPNIPQKIRSLLESCLRKDDRRRLRDMTFVRIEIEDAVNSPTAMAETRKQTLFPSRRLGLWPALALLFFLTSVGAILRFVVFSRPASLGSPARFEVLLPGGAPLTGQFKLSPDGQKLAFVAGSQVGKQEIWVRRIDSFSAEPLPSTEGNVGVGTIFWSADSQYIGYYSDNQLKKVAAAGGPSQVICNVVGPPAVFGTWNADGVILLGSVGSGGPLLRVSELGGQPVPITELDTAHGETSHSFPFFLPDGRHYFYLSTSSGAAATAYIGTLGAKDRRPLPGIASPAQFDSSGHVYYVRDRALVAQQFDFNRLELRGDASPIADVSAPPTVLFSVTALQLDLRLGLFTTISLNGSIAYRAGQRSGGAEGTELVWFDRKGTPLGLAAPAAEYTNPGLSRDGSLIAFERGSPQDIFVLDVKKGVTTRVTTHMAADMLPVWSPDGHSIVFTSDRNGARNLYTRDFNVVGDDKLLLNAQTVGPDDWACDGKYIIYDSAPPKRHIWALSMPDRKPSQITFSEFQERGGRVSPDCHWIAYTASNQGVPQLVIQSFPEPGTRKQVSTEGGSVIRWRRDGKELYYLAPDATLMAVSINSTAASIDAGAPQKLFKAPVAVTGGTRDYDIAPDGRFLVNVTNPAATNPTAALISLILNWPASQQK